MNIIGIDLGGTKLLGIRAGEDGKVLQEDLVPTLAHEGPERVIDRILSMIGRLAKAGPVDAIGIDVPGPADPFKGIVYGPPNLPGWPEKGVPLLQIAKDRLWLWRQSAYRAGQRRERVSPCRVQVRRRC